MQRKIFHTHILAKMNFQMFKYAKIEERREDSRRFCGTVTPHTAGATAPKSPRVVWRGRSPSNFNPQGQLRRPEDSDFCEAELALRKQKFIPYSLRSICKRQIDSASRNVLAQIEYLRQHALRPEISAEISAKTAILSPTRSSQGVSPKAPTHVLQKPID